MSADGTPPVDKAAYWDGKAAEAAEKSQQALAADAFAEVLLADLDASYCRARAEQVRPQTP